MSYGSAQPLVSRIQRSSITLHDKLVKTRVAGGAQRKPCIGSWLMLPGHSLARMIGSMEYDWVLIDTEHGNISDDSMHASVQSVTDQGSSPVVRIAGLENWMVKRALDTGATAIMCPMVGNAEEAKRLVSYCKFPIPTKSMSLKPSQIAGTRGVGSPFCAAVHNQSLGEYIKTANENTLVIVQIETREGLENCEKIAQVPGIDMLFVGPNDLASSLGYVAGDHPDIPEVQEAIARVLKACQSAGKYSGMFCTSGEQVKARFEQGFDFMNLGFDVVAISAWNAAELAKVADLR